MYLIEPLQEIVFSPEVNVLCLSPNYNVKRSAESGVMWANASEEAIF
jgi:hypothetical protein